MSTLRAAAHVHSEWSDDASWPLTEIASAFGRRGYGAVLLAEHSRRFDAAQWDAYVRACSAASTPSVLLLPGIEYNDPDNEVHIPVWGELPFLGRTPRVAELLTEVAAAGGISVLAHPWRRDAWRRFDPSWARHLTAIEVWNRKYDGFAPNRRAARLARRAGLREWVSIDFHTGRQFFPLAMALRLDGGSSGDRSGVAGLDRAAVHRALRAGRFEPMLGRRPVGSVLAGPRLRTLEMVELARKRVAPAVRGLQIR